MAVFRVEKNKNYTVMSNYHLRDTYISLKAKGLLSLMLSLPEGWDYTTKGLSKICKDGVDSICATVKELEENGYVIRERIRNQKGQLTDTQYTILEEPQPKRENPVLDKPILGKPELENPRQLNTKELNINKSKKDQSIFLPEIKDETENEDKIDSIDICRKLIKSNIEYDAVSNKYRKDHLDEILEILVETLSSSKKYIRIGGEDLPTDRVKSKLMKLNQFHIEYVIDCLGSNTTKIHNIKNYLLTSLYNAPATINHYYQAEVNHDKYGA